MIHATITVQGIVQGVGFRPFVYRLARQHCLAGYVANLVSGVLVEVEGTDQAISGFLMDLEVLKPQPARINDLQVQKSPVSGPGRFHCFSIAESRTVQGAGNLPPDLHVCAQCLEELFSEGDRRYRYPFINCTDCGPRYTIIENLPFDRPRTSMKEFALCPRCAEEYRDPADRRFHAQATCCPECGPLLSLADNRGRVLACPDPIVEAAARLSQGQVVAVKGIGGFHLAVSAENESAVVRLRERKGRPHKPLAIMARDLTAIRQFAEATSQEESWLTCRERPIVLLRRSSDSGLAASLAPGQHYIGVMLPYTPVHYLLFAAGSFSALVMTSGNRAGEPIAIANREAAERLAGVADAFLWHDRPILVRNDDSVIKPSGRAPIFIRRSRSFAPLPLPLRQDAGCTLALGGAEKVTVCLTRGQQAYLSQHLGELDSQASLENYSSIICHLQQVLGITPKLAVHDFHPDYPSTRFAASLGLPRVAVQHHHAHAVSCMAEHGLDGPVLAIILDGSGYGPDGSIWGGEVLRATLGQFTRLAHFTPFPLLGGATAIREPWRQALVLLYEALGKEGWQLPLPVVRNHETSLTTLEHLLIRKVNSPLTSSCGRLFDGVAALLGLRESVTYEGQAAMELEALITRPAMPAPYSGEPALDNRSGCWQLDPAPMIREIVDDLLRGTAPAEISHRFHHTVAGMLQATCRRLRDSEGLDQVVLSGGVFQNLILLDRLSGLLAADGFRVYTHRMVPPNDGGLALGQALAGRYLQPSGERHGLA